MSNQESDILNDFHNYCINPKKREIFLHNYYSSDDDNPGVEWKMASVFIKNLRALEIKNYDPITIHMHSIGGEWADGMAIFDAIKICNSYITMVSYGQAESMSSIILQAADLRLVTPNSYFMSHFGSSGIEADFLNAQNWIKYEKYLCDVMLDIYSSRCVKGQFFKEKYVKPDIKKVKNYLYKQLKDGDWYLNAEDCVHYGFADKVIKNWADLQA
jgi:ATP-dependent protease ClpP protease subunit|tara:strand:- start:3370 stop:4014 length:645 start_codon:yes stop_codon:yes gene_type:complete